MYNQPKVDPLERSEFFGNELSARPPVEGTIARGQLQVDQHLYKGRLGDELAVTFPFAMDRDDLHRGMARYNIYCANCHDRTGYGNGMIVLRGFRKPPSLHEARLRDASPGYFFDVITNGFGTMYSLAHLIPPRDRWLIVGYIRALQRSQHASIDSIPAQEQQRLRKM